MTNIEKLRKIENDKLCECGHRRGVHNIKGNLCLTYPSAENPYDLCNCNGYKEKTQ